MALENDADDEQVRRTVHVLLDYVSTAEGLEHTSELPAGWGEQVMVELVELMATDDGTGQEIMNFSVLLRAVTYIVDSLLLTIVQRDGDDRLALISSLREGIDRS